MKTRQAPSTCASLAGCRNRARIGRFPRAPAGVVPHPPPPVENVRGAGFCAGGSPPDSHAGRLRLGRRYVAVDFLLCISTFMLGAWFSERFVWQQKSSLPHRALCAACIPTDGVHGTRAAGRQENEFLFRCAPVTLGSSLKPLVRQLNGW